MSCYQCFQSFGILNKELSCKSCRFSFCSRCLIHKIKIPTISNDSIKVCQKCYTSEKNRSNDNFDIPKNLQKLKEKNIASKTKSGISDLEKRVSNLRSNNIPPSSTEDIEKRLYNLKGIPTNNVIQNNQSPVYVKPKSEQDQISQLLLEYQDEVNLNKRAAQETNETRDKDIETRLLNLGNSGLRQNTIKQNNDYLNPEKVLEKIFDEIKIEDKYQHVVPTVPSNDQYDELPYCCLCTKDAVWRCHECDEDLYCNSCYNKCHKKSEYGFHKHTEYKPIKQ